MSLQRLTVVLAGALVTMLGVVMLRAEATRLHYELSQLDSRSEVLWLELREKELELARLRNPALIRARVTEMMVPNLPADPPAKKNVPKSERRKAAKSEGARRSGGR
jgi:hypothetical protein